MQKLAKISTPNLFIRCSTSGRSIKQLTGEYFDKMRESIVGAAPILMLDKRSDKTDEGVCIKNSNLVWNPYLSSFWNDQVAAATGRSVLFRLQVLSQKNCGIL